MDQQYRKITVGFFILIFGVLIISCQQIKSSKGSGSKTERTIQNALSWVYGHPAHFAEGSFIEISEEIITFHMLYENSEDQEEKKDYIRQIQKRLDLVASKKDFQVRPPEYTMFLAIASISEKLGLKGMDFRKTVEDQMLSDPLLYPPHITSNIWNTVYLERMGYNPPRSLGELIAHSTLAKEVRQRLLYQHVAAQFDPMFIDPISITTYDMTHEIFSVTDFGKLPPPPIIQDNQAYFSNLFDKTIEWAITAKHIDVLAEVIMCVKMLNLEGVKSLDRGIEFIMSQQKGDGSFGVTNPGRPNRFRHGILVSIMALSLE